MGLPQVRTYPCSARPPSLLDPFTYRILGFDSPGLLTHGPCLTKVHLHLSSRFDSGFLQIPHWPFTTRCILLLQRFARFLWTPLPSSTYSLLSGLRLIFHQLGYAHAGRTRSVLSQYEPACDRSILRNFHARNSSEN
jgi:hypothetical protein